MSLKECLKEAWIIFIAPAKETTWGRLYILAFSSILLGWFLNIYGYFDLNLGITLAVVEIPIIVFGAIVANIILRESLHRQKEIETGMTNALKKLPQIDENQKHIEEHCRVLIDRFKERVGRAFMASIFTELALYNSMPDKEQLLQHFYTGHEELLYFLKQSIDLEKEMDKIPKPVRDKETTEKWQALNGKYNEAHGLYKNKIEELLGRVERKSARLGGICNECKKWHDSKDENFKQLESKLSSFSMPF
jgi:hypothetical protein